MVVAGKEASLEVVIAIVVVGHNLGKFHVLLGISGLVFQQDQFLRDSPLDGVSGHGCRFRNFFIRPLAAGHDELGQGLALFLLVVGKLDGPVDSGRLDVGNLVPMDQARSQNDQVVLLVAAGNNLVEQEVDQEVVHDGCQVDRDRRENVQDEAQAGRRAAGEVADENEDPEAQHGPGQDQGQEVGQGMALMLQDHIGVP